MIHVLFLANAVLVPKADGSVASLESALRRCGFAAGHREEPRSALWVFDRPHTKVDYAERVHTALERAGWQKDVVPDDWTLRNDRGDEVRFTLLNPRSRKESRLIYSLGKTGTLRVRLIRNSSAHRAS